MVKTASKKTGFKKIRSVLGKIKYWGTLPVRWFQNVSIHPIGWIQGGPAPAISRLHRLYELTPQVLLAGYLQGTFPTGEKGSVVWHCPEIRGVIHPAEVHISKRLKGYLNKRELVIRYDTAFQEVIEGCADRKKTWITGDINRVYRELHEMGYAHCVEAWDHDQLVGGGYGVVLGRVFFLESMFCRQDQASKIAFVQLARKLEEEGFHAIDCQFLSEHWRRFGAQPMERHAFQSMVARSLNSPARFPGDTEQENRFQATDLQEAASAV